MGTTILLGIISIGILIFVHELGHFLVSRAVGIKVEVFSIGWGKGITLFRWRETKIQLGFIPFGGYCKMAGDSPRDELTGSSEEYYSSAPHRRILVALGGPLFNFIFAFFLFTAIVIIGYTIHTYPNKILLAKPEDIGVAATTTPAQKAGLQNGDIIVEINGHMIHNWDDITRNIVRNALKPLRMTVLRGGNTIHLTVVPKLEPDTGRGVIGIYPWVEPIVGAIDPQGPAAKAGIKKGDRIVSVDGKKITNHMEFYDAIKNKAGRMVKLRVTRNGISSIITLIPQENEGFTNVGFYFKQEIYNSPNYPVDISIVKGFKKSIDAVNDTVRGIILVFSGKIRVRSAVAGPAKLIYISGTIAKEGIVYFFQVMSYISIAFFIMNLIPFPALDGSHIIIALYEIVARKKPKLEIIYKIQAIGFIILILVLVFVTMNDITSFIRK